MSYGSEENKLCIDSDITPKNEVLMWIDGEDGDEIVGTEVWISKEDAKGIIDELKSLFGLEGVDLKVVSIV